MIKIYYVNYSHVGIDTDPTTFADLYDYFSFYTNGYKFDKRFQRGLWDGKIHLLKSNGLLPFGLWQLVLEFAKYENIEVELSPGINTYKKMDPSYFNKWLAQYKLTNEIGEPINPYWYQTDSIKYGLENNRCILNLPTSAGKSLIATLIIKYLFDHNSAHKVLIIVPTVNLVTQMKNDISGYGDLFNKSDILENRAGSPKDDDNCPIYVSTWQSACKQPRSWFSQFDAMICDEVHKALAKQINKIIDYLDTCPIKIGMSGTLKSGRANLLQYIGMFGSVFKPISTKQMIEEGNASKVKISVLDLRYPDNACKFVKQLAYADEIKLIEKCKKRNTFISKLSNKITSDQENTIIMVRHIEHGQKLYDELKRIRKNVFYIHGKIKVDEREKIIKLLKETSGNILITNYSIFSTGISIKNVHNAIIGSPVKSDITVIQTIGRLLRKHDSKEYAMIYDIIDDFSIHTKSSTAKKKYRYKNYAFDHGLTRIETYTKESHPFTIKQIKF